MKLQGGEKEKYQTECLNKNQAVVVASNMPKPGSEAAEKPATDKPAAKKHVAKKKEHKKSQKAVKLSPAASGVPEAK